MLRRGLTLALVGLVIGFAGAMRLTRWMTRILYGVTARDPATLVSVAAVLALVAASACYVPARRATKVDPLVALRSE